MASHHYHPQQPQQPYPGVHFGTVMTSPPVSYTPVQQMDSVHYHSPTSDYNPYLTSPLSLNGALQSPVSSSFSPNRPEFPIPTGSTDANHVRGVHRRQRTRGSSMAFSVNARPSDNPFSQAFETPQWPLITIHIIVCGLAYPVMLSFVTAANGKTLFLARLLVGLGCGIVGLTLGASLLALAKAVFEAATWATVIHQSNISDDGGIRLGDLAAHVADHGSPTSALRLLFDRFRYKGTDREHRKSYDNRWWSVYILLFLFNCVAAGALAFVLGRLIDISTETSHQNVNFEEVAIQGILSEAELQRTADIVPYFEDYSVTWTLSSMSSQGVLPPVISLPWDGQQVYFSEPSLSQLVPGGSGGVGAHLGVDGQKSGQQASSPQNAFTQGSLLRFPQWGLRTQCAKVPDGPTNILPTSQLGSTYVFHPRDIVKPLFDTLGVPFPAYMNRPFDLGKMVQNDRVVNPPDVINIAAAARFGNTGVTQTLMSSPLTLGSEGTGFITLETVLIRLDTKYAPRGKFSRQGTLGGTTVGFDAAVCLQVYEPYVVNVYNSSIGLPNTIEIVSRTAEIQASNQEKLLGLPLTDPSVARGLNSTSLRNLYVVTHQNSVNSLLKDNGPDGGYRPSPSVVSFTDGEGISGYTEFSAERYQVARSLADARNALPYFAGTGTLLARKYSDKVLTTSRIGEIYMAVTLGCVAILGLISGLFVPRLPFGQPRRGFDLYSWMSAFYAQELMSEMPTGINKNMELRDIVKSNSNIKLRYMG